MHGTIIKIKNLIISFGDGCCDQSPLAPEILATPLHTLRSKYTELLFSVLFVGVKLGLSLLKVKGDCVLLVWVWFDGYLL
jgi:hypothetical protein